MRDSVEQPQLRGFAFLKEKPYIEGLSEGLVSPKNGSSKGLIFKHHSRADKAFFKSKQSRLISVLVGTQGGIEKWLKTSGPARCALWVECAHPGPEDLPSKESNVHQKGFLKLVYRQRDAQAFYQPVLPESTLNISVIKNAGNKARRRFGDTLHDDGKEHDWTGLRHKEIHRRNSSQESEKYLWTWETRWSIFMKVAAFKQLSNMLSPGGVLWEFRRLLLQVIDLPEFLDIDVRHLELSEWLAHHPYAVFVTGSDTLVARTTPKGLLVWTILRFDLSKGMILLTKGKNLKGLEQNFGNFDKKPRIGDSSDVQPFEANEHHGEDQSGENYDQHPPGCGQLGWKVWRETEKQEDVSRPGPLETILQSIFEGEADCMVLKSLNTFFSSWKETYFYGFCLSTDLGTAFRDWKGPSSFYGKLSTKERCALSHLRSATREVKLKGLRVLLDLLLDVVGDPSITRQKSAHVTPRKQPRSTPVSSRTQSLMTQSQLQLPKEQDIVAKVTESEAERRTFSEERENLSLLSGLMAVMNREDTGDHSLEEKEKKFVGSQTERALKAAEMNWTRFEEMKSDRSYVAQDRSCLQTWYRLRWERVLEWLDYGFLEALLKEGVSKACEDHSKNEQTLSLEVRELADACTRVVEIVPRESCHRLVICLISLLHKVTEVIVALNTVSPQIEQSSLSGKVPTIEVRGCRTCVGNETMELQRNLKEKEKLKEAFDEMVCVCRILSLLVSSSVMIAATLAKENGLMLIFELYSSLVEEFPLSLKPVGRAGEDPNYVLPGEVLEAEELSVKVLRSPASCSRFHDAQCQVKVSDEDGSIHPATNQMVSTSTTGLPWLLLGQGGLEVPIGLRGYKTKKTPVTETSILSQFSQAFTTTRSCKGERSEPDGEGAPPEERRPHVPRLSLSTLRVENTKQDVNSLGHDDAGLSNELLREGENDVFVPSRSATDGSVAPMPHTIFNIVCEARLQLLQALASILATNSITLNEIRSELTQKLHEENGAKLISGFLPDLIGGPLNRFPACVQGKFKKLIFRVLFLLDESAHDHTDTHIREHICRVEEAEGPWWSPPPVRNTVKRFSDAILVEIQERLDYVLSRLNASLPGYRSSIGIAPIPSCDETINVECHVKAIKSRLWVDLARLAMILSDYVQVSPDKTCKSSDILKFCRKQITDTLTLLSSLGAIASWGPAPILAMQSVLKLFSVCIRDLLSAAQTTEHASAEADFNSLWQMMVEKSVYWNCFESYLSWLTLDVCQGCLGILLDDFQKSLQEPVRLYYCALGQKVGLAGISERVFASFQGQEASPKNVFGFLRLVVMLLRRRLDHWRGYMCTDDGFARELPFTFLEGIMNPNNGLLLMAIKQGPQILLLHCKDEPTHLQAADDLTPRQGEQSDTKLTMSKCSSCPWVSQSRGSQRKETLGLCAECANIVTNPDFVTDIAMGIVQESLMLLSEIFRLRVMSSERRLPSLNFVNPFLFCKYLNPFLDIVHSDFMNFYKKLTEAHTKCVHNDLSSPKYQKCCEETELEDQKISHLCCTYAEVLLAVAQNQSEDASQKFRKLCVMEFLVQQITLEYEFSQIAAPRLSRNEVEASSVGQKGLQGMHSSPADVISSLRNEESLRELCDTSSTSSSTSFRADSDLRAVNQELKNKYTIPAKLSDGQNSLDKEQQSQYLQLGFFSARDKRRFTMAVQQDQFDKCSSPSCKELMTQKEIKGNTIETPKSILPLLERDKINRSLSEGGTDSTVTTGSLTRMARELYIDDEGDNRVTRFVTDLYNPELVNNVRPETMTSAELQSEEMKGSSRNAAAKVKKLVYSGRFFDLNEEVERELEAEDGEWMHGVKDSNSKGKQSKITSARTSNEMNSAQKFNRFQDLEDSSLSSLSLVSGSGSDTGTFMIQIRPLIPKLNFTKAVQKCRPDIAEVSEIGERTEEIRTCEQYLDRKTANASASGSKLFGLSLAYEKERWKRRIYQNGRLHRLLLELFISLMLNPQGSLEAYYSDRFPMENSKINAPFFLSYHINHASNEYVMRQVVKSLEGDNLVSAFRILKLTWRGLFDPSLYTNRVQIAQGAFAQVYTATREKEEGGVTRKELVVLKVIPSLILTADDHDEETSGLTFCSNLNRMLIRDIRFTSWTAVVDLPKGPREPCRFFDIYSEVQILELFRGDSHVCQILDYGIDCDTFVLVLKHYKCSLRAWRHRHTSDCFVHERDCIAEEVNDEGVINRPFHERLPLYLEVYAAVLQAVKALEIQNVVHYDLKCDNVLLEPLMSTLADEEFWHPHWPPLDVTSAIPFRVSITDFGQSKASLCEGGECTVRNRGTECVKSPEMLKLLSTNPDALQMGSSSPEVEISVGKAGDVWGLGCLLYELLTGEYLLYDEDWLQFFMRATSNTEELIPDEKAAKVDNFAPVIDFLRFVLVRDPNDRPTLDDLMEHLEQLQAKLIEEKGIVESVSNGCDELPGTAEQDAAMVVGNACPPKESKSLEMEKTQAPKRITWRKAGKVQKDGMGMQSKFTKLWWRYCACCWKNVELAS